MSEDAHTQAVVVAVLARIGPASVAMVAHESGIDEGTVRRALRVLEAAGIASRPRSHGPWSLTGKATAAAATKAESHDRDPDPPRWVAPDADRAPTGKKPAPWWHGNPSTRSWWERKRLKDKELRAK
jgi:predicted transcriptional regulator